MVELTQLLEKVAAELSGALEGEPVYIGQRPEGWARPSCLVSCGQLRLPGGVARALERRELDILVTAYAPEADAESYGHLIRQTEAIMDLFRPYHFWIGDRALSVSARTCVFQGDSAEGKVTLIWTEELPSDQSKEPAEQLGLQITEGV